MTQRNTEEEMSLDGTSNPIVALLEQHRDSDSSDLYPDEGPGDGAFLDLFDPGVFGYSESDVLVGLVGSEEGDELASRSAQELNDAATRSLSDARQGTRKKSELVSFSEEDFEGPQRDAFILIRHHKNLLFGASSKPADQWRAIDWFFTYVDNGHEPTFDLACRAFGARIDVVRLRIHYEFFLRWFSSPIDFPFETVPVPDIIAGEVAYIGGEAGQRLASAAWVRPGIRTADLLAAAGTSREYTAALAQLEDKLILCQQSEGYWYLTGRNPYLLRQRLSESHGHLNANLGGSIHWSRML
ncbi:hypothetical protein [Ottowia sp.]|uniref:hypothetical protein n=1 Tax=Ottowia sp. TaxID=1898956 RepID=UPI0025FD426F|nr:hypothetical protein [Ottowia sp.]MBK6616117.1 hypothetical protein [Ottowia sp.]